MAALKLYPVGIQTFERIRKEDKLYVDKTEYIYRMTHSGGCYFFLNRPRRFGKSLLISTFQSYFEGKKDLFKGLAIEKLEQEWTEYPVLHFDMSGGKHLEKKELEDYLGYQLANKEATYGITTPQNGANNRLTDLILTAYRKTGKQVVVLIDEYDAPLLDVVHEDTSLQVLRNVMRNFYSPLKMCEPYLRFVFLTGITKFSQMSIFSELNNITNVSMLPSMREFVVSPRKNWRPKCPQILMLWARSWARQEKRSWRLSGNIMMVIILRVNLLTYSIHSACSMP